MSGAIESRVRSRAGGRCEYCRLPESASGLPHVIDHIIARQHRGRTVVGNLALCCGRCNACKGPNIASLDPDDEQLTRLFHPRADGWADHFRYDGPVLVGTTAAGRATVEVLAINTLGRVSVRVALTAAGYTFE